jgi:hypothetical protein
MLNFEPMRTLFRKSVPKPEVSGITIFFLQKRLERFTDEQLSGAMQRGWRKKYDETNFYGMSTFGGQGALLKFNAMFFPFQHFERRADSSLLGDREMPLWAAHDAYTSFGYACPGGIPKGELRDRMFAMLGLFCAELLGKNTQALLFVEERVVLRYDDWLIDRLRSGKSWNPSQLLAARTKTTQEA